MAKFRFNEESRRNLRKDIEAHTIKEKKRIALALDFWADDTKGDIQQELVKLKAVDQGLLAASTDRTPAQIQPTKIKTTVFNNTEYATIVEFGRRPGKHPPLLPLVAWAGRKGIVKNLPRNITFGGQWAKYWAASAAIMKHIRNRKAKSGKRAPLVPEVLDLLKVRLIAEKIFKKGVAGRHPFTRVYERKRGTFSKDIANLLRSMR